MKVSGLLFAGVMFMAMATTAIAQDSRSVVEPVIPDAKTTCSLLFAEIASTNGDLSASDNAHFDTERIQSALDACSATGGTVELRAANGNDAFQIAPITLPSNVTLLIDPAVTVYASLDPRDYDVASGSCGIIAQTSAGCKPLITVQNTNNAAIMGGGVINGRGGDDLVGQTVSWWDLARQAQAENSNQQNPRLLQINSSTNFTLFQITIENAPNFHVALNGCNGVTIWGVTIKTPYGSRNTDGIDPGNSTNITITDSSITDGDDNVAIGASSQPASNITVSNNWFGPGHGMSIGSYTSGGVSNVAVTNLAISGQPGDHNQNGIRIKSDVSRGGVIQGVSYSNVCMQNVYGTLQFNPFYTKGATGTKIPFFKDIALHNIHVLTEGKLLLDGYDADHPLGLTLDNVIYDAVQSSDTSAQYANITLGPGPVNLPSITGTGVTVTNDISNSNPPYSCAAAFPGQGPVLTVGPAGQYATVQSAVDALPATGGTIQISPGTYTEVVHVNTPNARIVGMGSSPSDVVITYDNSAGTPNGNGGTLGTSGSGTFYVKGDVFYAENVTFQNTFDMEHNQDTTPGAQAVALYVNADRAVFRNVNVIGRQDTLYANSKGCSSTTCTPARQYFYNSYIEGNVDFIFGDGATVFDHCTIKVDEHGSNGETTITAQSKLYTNYLSGYVFINSHIIADPNTTNNYLGRPWRTYSTNVFLDTYLDLPVKGAGWIEFTPGTTNNLPTSYYAEYRSMGPGAAGWREPYAIKLTAAQAQAWEPDTFLLGTDNWRPTLVH